MNDAAAVHESATTAPSPGAPAVSVVIPTRNRPQYLREALAAIGQGDWQDFEVLVMDQTDGDATEQVVAAFDPRFRYHRVPRVGACPARNLGASLARADIVAFTDDDVTPEAPWLHRIVDHFNRDARLDFIFGQLKAPSDSGELGWYPETLFPTDVQDGRRPRRIASMGSGANMSCRKDFLRRLGGFDELLGPDDMYTINSDAALAYKAYRRGNWIARPDIQVIHKNGFRAFAQLARLFDSYDYELGANYARFARRGDWTAAWVFFMEQWDILSRAAFALLRLRRPRRLRALVPYARGFIRGFLLDPRVGYVDGAVFRRMEEDGALPAADNRPAAEAVAR